MKRLGVLALMLVACGSDDNTNTKQDAQTVDAPKDAAADAAHDAAHDAATPDAPPDAPDGTQQLTVKNYLNWCSVSVNGGAASSAAQQQVNVQPGTIALTASPLAAFRLDANMWHHTDGDTSGNGEGGTVTGNTSATTVTVTSASGKCVWVCCPFQTGDPGCPTTDICP
jgi:hypothetical protein